MKIKAEQLVSGMTFLWADSYPCKIRSVSKESMQPGRDEPEWKRLVIKIVDDADPDGRIILQCDEEVEVLGANGHLTIAGEDRLKPSMSAIDKMIEMLTQSVSLCARLNVHDTVKVTLTDLLDKARQFKAEEEAQAIRTVIDVAAQQCGALADMLREE